MLDLYFLLELNLMMSFRNEDTHLWQIVFFFVFYSVCKTKQTDQSMNSIGDSVNGRC